ncbi:hypothetical protein GGH19_003513 [Coemansia sp. RSA 1807]|nr:hypothetical protein GGH19_003513 [Coemansia sp. RSA 1807]
MKVAVAFTVLSALVQTGFAKCIPSPTPDYSVAPSSDYSAVPSSDYSAVPSSDYSSVPSSDYATEPAPSSSDDVEPASSSNEYTAPALSSDYTTAPAPSSDYATSSAPETSDVAPETSDTEAETTEPTTTPSDVYQITASQLDAAVPAGKGSGKCTADNSDGCANNEQALVALNNAAQKYGVTERGEVVAMIALMAFESGSWQYNVNEFPGRAGQGTKAMFMYPFIYKYAKALYPDKVQDAWESATDDLTMNNVRAMVLGDDDSFGSAFWYLTTQAPEYHNTGKLKDGDLASFKEYCTSAVGAGWDDDRQKGWEAVNSALSA